MCETGVTQEQIDEMRLMSENAMLSDMQNILNNGGRFEFRGRSGESLVTSAVIVDVSAYFGYLLGHKNMNSITLL